jgi:hypothetical protein
MIKEETQLRHEMLIDFLSELERFKLYGKPVLKKIAKSFSSVNATGIDREAINNAVVVFTDVLNLEGGSIGNIDLYRLLRNYLLDTDCRERVNKALDGNF